MLERWSKASNGQEDITAKILNSGIRNDAQLLNQVQQAKATYNDSIMVAKKNNDEMVGMLKKFKGMNGTPEYTNKFCSMLCQKNIRV